MAQLTDMQGKLLAVGDRVAYSSYHNLGLTIGYIRKLGRVRAEVAPKEPAFNSTPELIPAVRLIALDR